MGADAPRGACACDADPIPAAAGVGFKPEHVGEIFASSSGVAWFEVHPENYMGDGGPPHRWLTRLRESFPLSLHGVGLSIGGAGRLDPTHLARLKALVGRYQPGLFSEHLAWSSHGEAYLNDLLPLPYTEETLGHVARHVDETQAALGREILIENPSTYVRFAGSDMDETTFFAELSRRTGCFLLLDVNNVFVSAVNHGFDPFAYIDAFPAERVREIHLAGHLEARDDDGTPLLIDAHDRAVLDTVWRLYAHTLKRTGPIPTLVEWDNDVPAWPVLAAEAQRANAILMKRRTNAH
jgi:uncharacterized protein (UPF0276 family)